MLKDFIPAKDSDLLGWLESFKKTGAATAAKVGFSPAEIAKLQQLCQENIDQINLVYRKRAEAKAEVTKKKSMRKTHIGQLRLMIKRMKASAVQDRELTGTAMGAMPIEHKIDWDHYLPVLKASAPTELIEIKFRKYGMDAMQFHGRFNDGEWKYLGQRSHSPFYYKPEGHVPGTLTKCEFKGRAIIKDELVGVESNPVTVMYAPKPLN